MPKTVKGGKVYRTNQTAQLATLVDKLEFSTVDAAKTVPVGAVGTLYLVSPPPQIGNYNANDTLNYEDGNHNNDYRLLILSNYGPSKYQVSAQ